MRILACLLPLALAGACYDGGNGTPPPTNRLNFPVGLAVSKNGGVLYVANSDFDLQFSGGTIQAYNLDRIRRDTVAAIANSGNCQTQTGTNDAGTPTPFGQACAPPVDASIYLSDTGDEARHRTMLIGAFATGLYLNPDGDRLFVPVRGNASLTWADVTPDDPNDATKGLDIRCAIKSDSRFCDNAHQAGKLPALEHDNTRQVAMPGEPYGLAFSLDGTAAVLTHQGDTKVSLFATGKGLASNRVSLQFVLDGVPAGGVGVAAVPHATCSTDGCPPDVGPSFLLTSRLVSQLSLLRFYADENGVVGPSSQKRPFLVEEARFAINAAAGGSDSRGIAIDASARKRCVAEVPPSGGTRTEDDVAADIAACQRLPARVFIANRSPASIVVGEIGSTAPNGSYDPDRLVLFGNVPLVAGPSNVYLAPVVDQDGRYVMRLFVVCYDAQVVLVLDPSQPLPQLESVIRTGPGPFAMAFDPFDADAVARHELVPTSARGDNIKKFRFAYIASFLHSYIQVVDLDGSNPNKNTFETIVFNVGQPTPPKGS